MTGIPLLNSYPYHYPVAASENAHGFPHYSCRCFNFSPNPVNLHIFFTTRSSWRFYRSGTSSLNAWHIEHWQTLGVWAKIQVTDSTVVKWINVNTKCLLTPVQHRILFENSWLRQSIKKLKGRIEFSIYSGLRSLHFQNVLAPVRIVQAVLQIWFVRCNLTTKFSRSFRFH